MGWQEHADTILRAGLTGKARDDPTEDGMIAVFRH